MRGRKQPEVDVASLFGKVEQFARSKPAPQQTNRNVPTRPVAVAAPPPAPVADTFIKDDWFRRWSWNADKDPLRILRASTPVTIKPRPRLPRLTRPPKLSQEVWLDRLYLHYCDVVAYGQVDVNLVQDFRLAMPIERAHLERFVLNPRVILLTGRRPRGHKPGAHCVICQTVEEVRYIEEQLIIGIDSSDLLEGWL